MSCWLVVAFDGGLRDPRKVLRVDFDGLTLHVKPNGPDGGEGPGGTESKWADLISVFVEDPREVDGVEKRVNRFLSALSWKDQIGYATLGSIMSGCRATDRENPRFNFGHPRVRWDTHIGKFDFEHLVVLVRDDQRLALALYRDALASNTDFYRFLNFYKIINIRYHYGADQKAWIDTNLTKVGPRQMKSKSRADELLGAGKKIGEYLYEQGRCAIAHASYSTGEAIRDPDDPKDRREITKDLDLMQELAQVFMEDELGIASMATVWKQHLYELAGFKELFGNDLSERLAKGESVPLSSLPSLPMMDLRLSDRPPYPSLTGLSFLLRGCEAGRVFLMNEEAPVRAALLLDFPGERLTLVLEALTIDASHSRYSRDLEINYWQFMLDYFSNGYLEVYDTATGRRLSQKTAFIPDFNQRGIIDSLQDRIRALTSTKAESSGETGEGA